MTMEKCFSELGKGILRSRLLFEKEYVEGNRGNF